MKILALIGIGAWGKNILSTLEELENANLKYLCANNIESISSYGEKYVKLNDWNNLLSKKDLSGVLIATPAISHAAIAIEFLKHNISVFVEKPMAMGMAEAIKLREVAKNSTGIFMVGYQYIYNDYINFIKKEIESGSFGRILEVRSEHFMSPPRPDTDILYDAGSHTLSIFKHFFNPQRFLSSKGEISHDSVALKIEFANAPLLEINASSFGDTKTRKLTVVGEKSTAILDETLSKNKLQLIENGNVSNPEINFNPPLQTELKHFINCIETRRAPLTNIDFGYTINEWLDEISNSTK